MKLEKSWAEALGLALCALGFLLAILLRNPILGYISVFLGGLIAGRIYYLKKYKEPILPFVLMILGFLLGYLAGSLWASRVLVLMYFIVGFIVSYYLHLKEILATFKSENFVK